MKQDSIKSVMNRINDYIHGRLSQKEIDALWIEFLKAPEWYNLFETELHFIHLAKHTEKNI